jgi:hypothetical protein
VQTLVQTGERLAVSPISATGLEATADRFGTKRSKVRILSPRLTTQVFAGKRLRKRPHQWPWSFLGRRALGGLPNGHWQVSTTRRAIGAFPRGRVALARQGRALLRAKLPPVGRQSVKADALSRDSLQRRSRLQLDCLYLGHELACLSS